MKGMDNIIQSFQRKPFRGRTIEASPVYKPDRVLVKGFQSCVHEDTIESYFDRIIEDQTGRNEEHVYDVQKKSGNQALVFFYDCSRRLHCI